MDAVSKLDAFPGLTVIVNNREQSPETHLPCYGNPASAPLPARLMLQRLEIRQIELRQKTVSVNSEFLRHLMTEIARTHRFDAQFYLATYPDVEAAHIAGDITNLHQHYLQSGYFEGRLPHEPAFDPKWYFEHYPDLAGSYSADDKAGLHRHYLDTGMAEGRLGSPLMCGSVWHNG